MEFQPKVSIVIPVYNGSNYMRKAIDSALNQTYQNKEIVVINDGSADSTEEIALSYGQKIRYYKKENGGQSSALNFGIDKMEGDYFSWLSHDDVYNPDKLEVQIQTLSQLEDKNVILYSDYEDIDENDRLLNSAKIPPIPPSEFLFNLLTKAPISGCSTLVPKSCFEAVGLFNDQLPTTSDYDMWFRLGKKFAFHHIPQALIKNRVHGNQVSVKKRGVLIKETNAFLSDCLKQIDEEGISISTSFPDKEQLYYHLSKNFSKRGYTIYKLSLLYARKYSPKKVSSLLKYYRSHIVCSCLIRKKQFRLFVKTVLYAAGLYKHAPMN